MGINMSKVTKVVAVIFGILMVIGGVVCLFSPISTSLALGYVVGLVMVLDAVGRFIYWWQERKAGSADGWTLAGAILSLVFGFFILNSAALQLGVNIFIMYYVAFWLVLHGIISIVHAWKIRKLHKEWNTKMLGEHWYIPLCIGILVCVFGVLCLFKPVVMASVIGVFIGLGIISAGADLITLATLPGPER